MTVLRVQRPPSENLECEELASWIDNSVHRHTVTSADFQYVENDEAGGQETIVGCVSVPR